MYNQQPDYMRYILILFLVISFISLNPKASLAQETSILNVLDSLYWEKEFNELVSIAESEIDSEKNDYVIVGLHYYLGNAKYRLGNFKEALKLTEDNYFRAEKLPLSDSLSVKIVIDVCQKLGDYSFQAEKYEQGIAALKKGININEKYLDNDNWRLVKLYHKLGALLRIAHEYNEAQEKLEYGINTLIPRLSEQYQDRITPAYQSEIAILYNDKNQPRKAIEIYKEMIQIAEETENIARVSIYNNNCAIAYSNLRNFPKAKYHMQKNLAANLKWQGPKTRRMINSYTNLADINTQLGLDDEALDDLYKAIDLTKEVLGENSIHLGKLYSTLGAFHLNHDNLDEAIETFQKVIKIQKDQDINNDIVLSDALQNMGKTLLKIGQIDEGIQFLKRAVNVRTDTEAEQINDLGTTYAYLYDAYMAKGDIVAAKKNLDQSFDAVKYNLDRPMEFNKLGTPNFLIIPLSRLIAYHSALLKDSNSAFEDGQQSIEIANELIKYLRYNQDRVSSRQVLAIDIQPLHNAILDFYYIAYEKDNNTSYIEGAFSTVERSNNTFLYENLAEDGENAYQLPNNITEKRNQVLNKLSNTQQKILTTSSNTSDYEDLLSQLNKSNEELYALIDEIKLNHTEYYNTIYNFPISNIEETQNSLSDGELFISYYFGTKNLYAISIDQTKTNFIKLAETDRIKSSVISLISNLKNKNNLDKISSQASDLYEKILSPFNPATYSTIIVCTDNVLGLLPFEILNNNGSHITNQSISYQYSATLMNSHNLKGKGGKGLLAMAPVFDSEESISTSLFANAIRESTTPLPETEHEVNIIGNLFSSDVLLRSDATLSSFKKLSANKSILHLATHGYADQDNASKSYLYFSQTDSTQESSHLYAEEIAQMKINADLITLSACNTGIGKIQEGEGVASLGRAFSYAGCQNQVLSLWAVNDKTTTELMSYFYANLKEGQTKPQALTNAKAQYLEQAPDILKHPYYWAGFVYYGDDTRIKQQSIFDPLTKILFLGILLIVGFFIIYKLKN